MQIHRRPDDRGEGDRTFLLAPHLHECELLLVHLQLPRGAVAFGDSNRTIDALLHV